MNRFLTYILSALALVWADGLARGQTLVDLKTQAKRVDFTGAASTKPFKSGASLPATCAVGEFFFKTTAPAGTNLYSCSSLNTWTLQSGGSGGGAGLPDVSGKVDQILSNDGTSAAWRALGGDFSGAPQALRVGGLQGLAVSPASPADGQVLRWNATSRIWAPDTIAGGSGGGSQGASNYSKAFTNATAVNILGTEHNYGTAKLLVACYDTSAPAAAPVEPDVVTVNTLTYDISIKFATPQSGTCVVNGSGGVTPVPLVGDLQGTSANATVTGIQNQPVSPTAPTDGQALTFNAPTGRWQPSFATGGGGSTSFSPLTVTYATPTTLIVGGSCTLTVPCNVRFGNTTYSFTTSATVSLLGGSGSAFIYIGGSGNLSVASSTLTLGCSAGCTTVSGLANYPANSVPLFTWSASNAVWTITGGHDNRAFLSSKAITSGLGVVILEGGTQTTVAVDAAVVPSYLSATASLTFPSIANAACSAEQSIALGGATPGDSVAPGWPSSLSAVLVGVMRVSANGLVAVRLCNFSGAALVPQAGVYRATVVRSF